MYHRLEARTADKVRTTQSTREAIVVVWKAAQSLVELERVAGGRGVRDLDGLVGRASVMRQRWKAVGKYVPMVIPRTGDMVRMLKAGLHAVRGLGEASGGTKAGAERVLRGLQEGQAEASTMGGQRVEWDGEL